MGAPEAVEAGTTSASQSQARCDAATSSLRTTHFRQDSSGDTTSSRASFAGSGNTRSPAGTVFATSAEPTTIRWLFMQDRIPQTQPELGQAGRPERAHLVKGAKDFAD